MNEFADDDYCLNYIAWQLQQMLNKSLQCIYFNVLQIQCYTVYERNKLCNVEKDMPPQGQNMLGLILMEITG